MGEHTYSVTDPGTPPGEQRPVNEWSAPENPGVTFNAHAWRQRTALVTALVRRAELAERRNDAEAAARYDAAAAAAESFTHEVQRTGGGGDVAPLTQQQIYQEIEDHPGTVTPPPPGAMARYRMPDAPEEVLPQGRSDGHAGTTPDGWAELSARDYEVIDTFHRAFYQQEAAEAGEADNTLHTGRLSARLQDVRIALRLPNGPGGFPADPEDVEVTLPEFGLDVQDEHWEGNAGEVAKERLAGMTFVLGLLRDATAEALRYSALTGMPGYVLPAEEA